MSRDNRTCAGKEPMLHFNFMYISYSYSKNLHVCRVVPLFFNLVIKLATELIPNRCRPPLGIMKPFKHLKQISKSVCENNYENSSKQVLLNRLDRIERLYKKQNEWQKD